MLTFSMFVATMNYQRNGVQMDFYDGRFMSNGGCGFVLKPSAMRDEVSYFSAKDENACCPAIAPQILHVKVRTLPCPSPPHALPPYSNMQ